MFVTLSQIEKILVEKGKCTAAQFRSRTINKRWSPTSYLSCYKAVLDHFDIKDPQGGEAKSLARFLKRASEEEATDPGTEIGPKRRHIDYSMAESSDEEDVHDISLSSAMSLDQPGSLLDLQRENSQLRRDIQGNLTI